MSFCVSSLRLLVITLLFLCSVVHIETNAIPQLYSKDGRNESRGGISSSSEITTDPTKKDLADIYDDSTSNTEDEENEGMLVNKGPKPEVVTNSLENITTSVVGTPDASTTDTAVIQRTTPTYIFSVTTKRSKIYKMVSEIRNRNTKPEDFPTPSKGIFLASNNAVKNRTTVDDSEIANIDIENDENVDVTLPRNMNRQNNNVSTEKINITSKFQDTNVKNVIPVADSNKKGLQKPNTHGQRSQSHIYKVNSNYKRYKKLNILPPKSLWRDPNDNSWRNESISSLGIKFKPKSNSTKGFQFRKKDLSELESLMSETENSTSPGLRERLEKLSEIRKSKKKHNTSAEMWDEGDIDYENDSTDSSHTKPTFITIPTEPTFIVIPTQSTLVTPTGPNLIVTPTRPNLIVTPTGPNLIVTPTGPNLIVTPTEPNLIVTPTEPTLIVTPTEPTLVTPTEPTVILIPTETTLMVTPTEATLSVSPSIHSDLKLKTSLSPKTTPIRMHNELNKRKHGMNDLKDKLVSERKKIEIPNTTRKKSEIVTTHSNFREIKRQKPKDQKIIRLPTEEHKISEARRDPEKIISHSNYKEVKYPYERDQINTTDVKNRFDYSLEQTDNDEVHDYEVELSKELINSSESWSAKKIINSKTSSIPSTTEITTIRESNNILDSLEDYINSNISNTTLVTYSRTQQSSDFHNIYMKPKYQLYDKLLTTTDAYVTSKFANPVDLPIGPRNKDKISLPQSYSYNSMPHTEISVQYNTSIIHKPYKERSNSNYNGEHVLPITLNGKQSTDAIFSSYHQEKSDYIQNHEFENMPNNNQKYQSIPNSRTRVVPVPQIQEAVFAEVANIEPVVTKIEPVPQNIATTYEHILQIPPNSEPNAQSIGFMAQYIKPELQNNGPLPLEPVHDHKFTAALPDISPAISQNIPPHKNIINQRIYHTSPFNVLTSHVRENPIIGGQSNNMKIHEELLSIPNPIQTNLRQELSNGPMHQNIAFHEPVLPDIINKPPNSPIMPSNLGQLKSQHESSVLPNILLQSVSQQDLTFDNVETKLETDMPLLYNSTVLHNLNTDTGQDTAVSNSYMKSIYEEVPSKKLQDVVTTTIAMAYIQGDRVEISPDYLIHYDIPDQNDFSNPKVIS